MAELVRELGARLEGEVRFDAGSRALYATRKWHWQRMEPPWIVIRGDGGYYSPAT